MSLALFLVLVSVTLITLAACGVGGRVNLFYLGIAVWILSTVINQLV